MKLVDLKPCSFSLATARESRTLRDAWDVAPSPDLMWLIGKAHINGTLPRRALVLVAVRCAETVAHLLDDASLPHLATVASWANGADDVIDDDLRGASTALCTAAYAVDAADVVAYAAYAAVAAVAAYAYDAAAYAVDADDAVADVIRDAVTLGTVCAALGLNPDEVL